MLILNIPLVTTDDDALNSVAALHSALLHMRVSDAADFRIIDAGINQPRLLALRLALQYPPTGAVRTLLQTLQLPWLVTATAEGCPFQWTLHADGLVHGNHADPSEIWTTEGRTLAKPAQPAPPLELRLETSGQERARLAETVERQFTAPNDSAVTPQPATGYW